MRAVMTSTAVLSRPGATALKPWGVRPYVIQGRSFPSLDALSHAIADQRLSHGQDVEFADAFIAEVVNTMHPAVVRRGYRGVRFRDVSYYFQSEATRAALLGSNCFEGYFLPIARWQDVTTYPWRSVSPTADLKAALRAKFNRLCRPALTWRDTCADCGGAGPLDYDHVAPAFNEIATACLALMSETERSTRFGYDKFCPGTVSVADFIPDQHAAVQALVAAHRTNVWQWRCERCHRARTAAEQAAAERAPR